MSVTVKDRTPEFRKALRALLKKQVLIGIPDGSAGRTPAAGDPASPSNATIGYVMETGDPDRNIPARPFLVPGVTAISDKAVERLRVAAQQGLSGDLPAVDKQMHAVGLIGQSAVRAKITDGPFVPLSPRTLADRRARGRMGDKPLIDTGQLRTSVTYVVREKGK